MGELNFIFATHYPDLSARSALLHMLEILLIMAILLLRVTNSLKYFGTVSSYANSRREGRFMSALYGERADEYFMQLALRHAQVYRYVVLCFASIINQNSTHLEKKKYRLGQ